jgi:hypothetical protein
MIPPASRYRELPSFSIGVGARPCEADLSEAEGVSLAELLVAAGSEFVLYDHAIFEVVESLGKPSSKTHGLADELLECSGSIALSSRSELSTARGLGLCVSSRCSGQRADLLQQPAAQMHSSN